jgi:hypothetical protein
MSAALALFACAQAQAGRPMVVDDAVLTSPGHCQVESWIQHTATQLERWAVPACNVGGQWELAAGIGHIDPDGAAAYRYGVVQAKTVFHPLQTNGWGIGLTIAHQFRQGEGLAGDLSAIVPLSVSLWDDQVLLHMNGGWIHTRSGDDKGFAAAGVEWALLPTLSLTLEAYGTQHSHAFAQAGMSYTVIPDRLALDAGVGHSIGRAGGEHYVTAGLTLTGPGLR